VACAYLAGYLAGAKVALVVALVAGTSKLVAALALGTVAFASSTRSGRSSRRS